ncbi:MAG: MlaD family protein [Solirubrobacteraceae bacterium]
MNRRPGSLAGSPLLIGSVTVLIIAVAVYISYNAINGLPFEPTYKIGVELPNASNLLRGNEVKIGGTRVGIVEKLVPKQNPKTGRLTAIAMLKLEKRVGPLPKNSKAMVLSVSSVGLKYLQLYKGTSRKTIPTGGTIPVSQTREPVDINQFFDMFNKLTRRANKVNLSSFGDGLAGRGVGLNETLHELLPLVEGLTPVMRNLAAPRTRLSNFFASLDRAAKEAAPVAEAQGRLYVDLNRFFGAWASVAHSLERSIAGGPSSLQQAIYSLPYQKRFIDNSTEFMRLLRPAAKALPGATKPFARALRAGAVNLSRARSLNGEIASSAEATRAFAQSPFVTAGLADLTETAKLGNPLLATLAPLQSKCYYVSLLFRNLASMFSASIGVGTYARVLPILPPAGPNNIGYPASAPANGPSTERELHGQPLDSNHLHYNPYPNVANCEAGNEEYARGPAVVGNAPSTTGNATEQLTRKDNRYGEPYSSAEQKALGIPQEEAAEKKQASKAAAEGTEGTQASKAATEGTEGSSKTPPKKKAKKGKR